MSCNGNVYNIGMGCCEPVLGPVENYYTKPTIDRMLEEKIPTSNTAFTNDAGYLTEHQHIKTINGLSLIGDGNIEIGTGGTIDLSNYYTTAQTDSLIESAVTRVEGEIPTIPTSNTAFTNDAGYLTEHQSLSGYATQQWVRDQHYITGVDLSNYATKAEIPVVPTSNTAFTNDAGYITGVDLSNYATTGDVNNVSTALTSHTSNTTIHVTPEQVASWNAKSDFSGSYNDLTDKPTIPTVPTSNTAFTNDAGYITGVDLSNYATKDNLTAATDDMATKTWVGQQGYLTQHQDISGKQDISGMTAYTETTAFTAHTSDTTVHVTSSEKSTWNSKASIWCGTMAEYEQISGSTDNNTIYLIHS